MDAFHYTLPSKQACFVEVLYQQGDLPSTPPWLPWAPQWQEIDVNKEFYPMFPSTSSRPKNTCSGTEAFSQALTGWLSYITPLPPSLTPCSSSVRNTLSH